MEPEGRSGRLALIYLDSFDVTVLYSNNHMINIEATIEGQKVFITFVYGDPVVEYRENVWERLTRMCLVRSGPWLMLGDFNEITSNLENKGGRRRTDTTFIPFRTMLANCGMIDFPFKGNPLSWVGNMASGKVQCRLDRAVRNEDCTISSPTRMWSICGYGIVTQADPNTLSLCEKNSQKELLSSTNDG